MSWPADLSSKPPDQVCLPCVIRAATLILSLVLRFETRSNISNRMFCNTGTDHNFSLYSCSNGFCIIVFIRLESSIRPRGGLICAIDATSLLANYSDPISTPWHERLLFKLQQVQMSSFALRHSVRVRRRTSEIMLQVSSL